MMRQRELQSVRALFARLSQAGFSDESVARWCGVARVTDARWLTAPSERARRGIGGWIALFVSGETVDAAALRPLPGADERAALVALGLIEDDGARLRPLARVLPWRGLVVASAADEAFDLSALNVAATLDVRALDGRDVWDVGCGAGLLSLAAARAGASVLGSDVDGTLVEWARLNAALNGVDVALATGDLLAAAPPGARFVVILFNAPLLRAPLASAAGEAPRYSSAAGGEALALAFLDGVAARLRDGGRVLVHAQLTAAVDAALDGWAERAGVLSVVFAHAPDGTAHALTELRLGAAPARRRLAVPLSSACPHLSRAIFDALGTARALDDAATPTPAPWLELRTSERFTHGARRTLERHFGGAAIDDEALTLLERLRGASLGELGLDADERTRLQNMIARGWVVLG